MKFRASNLVTLQDKQQQLSIRKADLDLLDKLNQLSSSVSAAFDQVVKMFDPVIETQTIRANAVLGTKTKLLLVDDNSAIQVTVPSGLPVGHTFTIQRISSGLTANAVTISSTDTFPFTSMFGNSVAAKTARYSETFTFLKVSATAWACVAGSDSGANGNGNYEATFDGKLRCDFRVIRNILVGTWDYGYLYSKAPIAVPVGAGNVQPLGTWTGFNAYAGANLITQWYVRIVNTSIIQDVNIQLIASGRWY